MSGNVESDGNQDSPLGNNLSLNPSVGKAVSAAFRRTLTGLGDCLERLCVESQALADRLAALEYADEAVEADIREIRAENKALVKRLDEVELELLTLCRRMDNSELRTGVTVTQKVAEASFGHLQQIPEVNTDA